MGNRISIDGLGISGRAEFLVVDTDVNPWYMMIPCE